MPPKPSVFRWLRASALAFAPLIFLMAARLRACIRSAHFRREMSGANASATRSASATARSLKKLTHYQKFRPIDGVQTLDYSSGHSLFRLPRRRI